MLKNFETKFIGWAFIFATIMLWGSWALTTHHIGEYIKAEDFKPIGENVWYWIWMYRIHIFGWVTLGIAMFALTSVLSKRPQRVVFLPGIGMMIVGTFTLAIAAAFYYNFGAWGVGQTTEVIMDKTVDKSPEDIKTFMDSILPVNQYVTCFVRFGRIFSGVGLVLLGFGFIKWKIIDTWLGYFTLILGLAAVIMILAISDNFDIFKPLFHLKNVWMLAMGVIILTKGLNVSEK